MANEKDLKNMLTDMDLDNVTGGARDASEYNYIIVTGYDGHIVAARIINGQISLADARPVTPQEVDAIKKANKGKVLLAAMDANHHFSMLGEC